jgi:hypothetical protein
VPGARVSGADVGSAFPAGCAVTHADLMDGYYAIRQYEWEQLERVTMEYPTEMCEYLAVRRRTTFKAYLIQMRGR